MVGGYFVFFFLLVFLAALGLSALFISVRERRDRSHLSSRIPETPRPAIHDPQEAHFELSEFERSVLRDIYGMTDEEIRLSETTLRLRSDSTRTYVTSSDRPDGFFQA